MKQEVNNKMNDMDSYFTESQDKIENHIAQVKKLTQDKMDKKDQELNLAFQEYMGKMATEIDKGMGNLVKTGVQKQKMLDNELRMVKEVCAKFFD